MTIIIPITAVSFLLYLLFHKQISEHFCNKRLDALMAEGRDVCEKIDALQKKINCLENCKTRAQKKVQDIDDDVAEDRTSKVAIKQKKRRDKLIHFVGIVDHEISKSLEKQINIINKRGYE